MDFKLSDRASAALSPRPRVAHMLSMVFEDCRPESPGVNVLARERPCLEHVLALVHLHPRLLHMF